MKNHFAYTPQEQLSRDRKRAFLVLIVIFLLVAGCTLSANMANCDTRQTTAIAIAGGVLGLIGLGVSIR